MDAHLGQIAALITACFWTVTAMAFESAGRRIGSLSLNLLRLVIALVFLTLFNWLWRGHAVPIDASAHVWFWLALSGLVGFTLGDLCLFRAYVLVGSRIGTLFMLLAPPITAVAGWLFLDERLTALNWTGMAATIGGVALAASEKRPGRNGDAPHVHATGMLLGVGAAFGQAIGLILSKYGMGDYSPFAATQIRALFGLIGFAAIFSFVGWWPKVREGARDRGAMARLTLGAFFGPFLGVSFSLMAVQHTKAGIAATIMSTTPILILLPAALIFQEKITPRAMLDAILTINGITLLFL